MVYVPLVVIYLALYQFTNAILTLLKKADTLNTVTLNSTAKFPVSLNTALRRHGSTR
ncbi:hypothetical protein SAMN05421797_102347 [Maribacter ulvicola]|uniref:Uncharacterized protein n=1 Tax=Maribacter ulvicola TaxID=228959 RepID=A0A1N6UHY0_9FLAO|nr:hypothetical protein SAMN05421797_102347 [Maribacter ulvicola]